ncbi:hypothetical protein ACUUL3_11935 [Thiovibrio sp. JS02]
MMIGFALSCCWVFPFTSNNDVALYSQKAEKRYVIQVAGRSRDLKVVLAHAPAVSSAGQSALRDGKAASAASDDPEAQASGNRGTGNRYVMALIELAENFRSR